MKIIITKDYKELSKVASGIVREIVQKNPSAVLGLATGSSPIGLYKNMIADYKAGLTEYKKIRTVNLDEYVGLSTENTQSYSYFMRENLFKDLDISQKNTHLPSGTAKDTDAECKRYTALLNELRQDLQVLGIGGNGHIGFNEPGTPFESTTHIVELKQETRLDNARFFNSLAEVPTHAITMGIKNITDAKKILVLASGAGKADAVLAMVKGELTTACPASVLKSHPDVTLIVDELAACKL